MAMNNHQKSLGQMLSITQQPQTLIPNIPRITIISITGMITILMVGIPDTTPLKTTQGIITRTIQQSQLTENF